MRPDTRHESFARALSHTLLLIVAVYVCVNVAFPYYCFPDRHFTLNGNTCAMPQFQDWLEKVVPAIGKPVRYLESHNNPERANLVASVYSFAWLSGLVSLAIMLMTSVFAVRIVGSETRQAWLSSLEQRIKTMPPAQKERANLGEIFVLLAIGLGLADAFIGIFDFTGRSRFTNTVTLFDRDLFRVCFDWSMILVCSILFYFRLARCIAERNLRRRLDVALR